ncbi:hypothetical protein OG585_19320 [Streptomyces sp. NBC_01340]|uniref:hypothetical protein n=1 Tax=unclassified Streptomyces TaxID=2593676 RepID=UPI00225B3328|nr:MULTISPECIES: hypothetical protein [unclassified Streptomyces]MCX4454801.1 hypothetical protein [Streptomyces sp. NBC_01719]MCX4494161.1 hypothetical protein [Streptomyces sp. NBC_01728]WSI44573.1 hypothetical protein OG585_19320 [Streptomyces sp. NBC_01340]
MTVDVMFAANEEVEILSITVPEGRSSWTWTGHGCDGTGEQAAQSYDSPWAALTAADAFLRDHFVALGWRDDVDVPFVLAVADRETCWCADIDDGFLP